MPKHVQRLSLYYPSQGLWTSRRLQAEQFLWGLQFERKFHSLVLVFEKCSRAHKIYGTALTNKCMMCTYTFYAIKSFRQRYACVFETKILLIQLMPHQRYNYVSSVCDLFWLKEILNLFQICLISKCLSEYANNKALFSFITLFVTCWNFADAGKKIQFIPIKWLLLHYIWKMTKKIVYEQLSLSNIEWSLMSETKIIIKEAKN